MQRRVVVAIGLLAVGGGLIVAALRDDGVGEVTALADGGAGAARAERAGKPGDCVATEGTPSTTANNCFVRVPGGTLRMGAQSRDPAAPGYDALAGDDEAPVHEVTLPSLRVLLTEVAVGQYNDCVQAGACRREDVEALGGEFNAGAPGRHLHPQNGVTWDGAARFCAWVGGRLPTEAEWEMAARGVEARRYPWGDEPPACDRAVMSPPDGGRGCGLDHTQEVWVPQKEREHPLGLRAMAGSVWEWTADWYDAGQYAASQRNAPKGPEKGTRRVMRGGAWTSEDPAELRGAFRAAMEPDVKMSDVGFRCVTD